MSRLYFPTRCEGDTVYLEGGEAAHINKVMRKKAGDVIRVAADEDEALCKIAEVSPGLVTAVISSRKPCLANPKRRITLFCAYQKADKLELVAQKAVELGMSCFYPFISEYCVKQPGGDSERRHFERICRIAKEAQKQCGRTVGMHIGKTLAFSELLQKLSEYDSVIFAYENAAEPLRPEHFAGANTAVIIGSEGGFSEREAELIEGAGARCVSLGARILRAETAAIALAAAAGFVLGEWA